MSSANATWIFKTKKQILSADAAGVQHHHPPPLLHNDSLLFLCWNTVLIKELKIAVDGPEDTFENKLDEMGSVIFDYRGEKKKDFEVYEKEMRQFEDERSDSRGTCLPNYKWEKGLMEGAFRKWRCWIRKVSLQSHFHSGEGEIISKQEKLESLVESVESLFVKEGAVVWRRRVWVSRGTLHEYLYNHKKAEGNNVERAWECKQSGRVMLTAGMMPPPRKHF